MVKGFKAVRRSGAGKIIEMPEPDIYWDLPKQPKTKPQKSPWLPSSIPYEHPPDYLVPVGNGFYSDPKEPPDPQDCNGAMSDISPWCGGNPLDLESIWKLNPAKLDTKFAFDECNVWGQLEGSLFGIKVPPKTLAYRFPGKCREEPPPPAPP